MTWGDALARGSEVVDYVIQYKKSTESIDDAKVANAIKVGGSVFFTFRIGDPSHGTQPLENGTSYDVRVWGVDAVGRDGTPSRWQSAIPVGPIGVPQNVTATASNGTISVAWQPPPASAGDTPTGYTVEWKRSTDPDTQWQSATGATSPHEISGLENGTTYNVRVFAVVRLNDGAPSAAVNAIPNTVPGRTGKYHSHPRETRA